MSEAILAFTSSSPLGRGLSQGNRLTLHWSLQLTAISFITIAFLSIYYTKQSYNKEHFASTHASLGLTTCISVGAVAGGGVLARYGVLFKSVIHPTMLKVVHASFGIVTYLLAIATICYGLQTEWFRGKSHPDTVRSAVTLVAIIGAAVVIKPVWTVVSRLRGTAKKE